MRRTLCLASGTVVLLLSSCVVVPYPTSKRIESRAPSKETFDLAFLHPGETKRAEVEQKLALMNSGANTPGLFWGRFIISRFGVLAVAYGAGADAGRDWSGQNVWVTYNDAGIVATKRIIPDSRLDGAFAEWFGSHARPVQLPLRIEVFHQHRDYGSGTGQLILDENQITYTETSCKHGDKDSAGIVGRPWYHPDTCDHHFVFPLTGLVRIHDQSPLPKKGEDGFQRSLVMISGQNKVSFFPTSPFTADELLDLLAYLRKNCPNVKYR